MSKRSRAPKRWQRHQGRVVATWVTMPVDLSYTTGLGGTVPAATLTDVHFRVRTYRLKSSTSKADRFTREMTARKLAAERCAYPRLNVAAAMQPSDMPARQR